jgi:multicomponent K+:H+ antiporter subunit C
MMEFLIATAIGWLTACGLYLMLRPRSFALMLGLTLLSYAVNLFIFASGRLALARPPIIGHGINAQSDPLPQALVLTAIVISFAMSALIAAMALGSWLQGGSDRVALSDEGLPDEGEPCDHRPGAAAGPDGGANAAGAPRIAGHAKGLVAGHDIAAVRAGPVADRR